MSHFLILQLPCFYLGQGYCIVLIWTSSELLLIDNKLLKFCPCQAKRYTYSLIETQLDIFHQIGISSKI